MDPSTVPPQPVLCTARLDLVGPDPTFAAEALDFMRRNAAHFVRWDPPRAADHLTLEHQRRALERGVAEAAEDRGYVWWLRERDAGGALVGRIHFSALSRGPFQNANLGYALDAAREGRGLMTEALQAALAEVFSPRIALHRVQAAYRPENRRSGAVLARLGFEHEGLAREYLFIDGAWRDHVLTALRNPQWAGHAPPGPRG